jgi:uncharacterized membrane protein YedE/YeeE
MCILVCRSVPTRKDIDLPLVAGAALFGAGWGMGAVCPGPGLVSLASGNMLMWTWGAGLVAGMHAYKRYSTPAPKPVSAATPAPTAAAPATAPPAAAPAASPATAPAAAPAPAASPDTAPAAAPAAAPTAASK